MDKKLPELKAEAKRLGLKRYSRLKKAELINLITRNSSPILDGNKKNKKPYNTHKIRVEKSTRAHHRK